MSQKETATVTLQVHVEEASGDVTTPVTRTGQVPRGKPQSEQTAPAGGGINSAAPLTVSALSGKQLTFKVQAFQHGQARL